MFQLAYRTPSLVNRFVGVGVPASVGIGDGDPAPALSGDFVGLQACVFLAE
jgi:hypothetical protein